MDNQPYQKKKTKYRTGTFRSLTFQAYLNKVRVLAMTSACCPSMQCYKGRIFFSADFTVLSRLTKKVDFAIYLVMFTSKWPHVSKKSCL